MLFLTRGKMPLEPAWREFFATAALVEPVDVSRLWTPDTVAPHDIKAQLAAIDRRDAQAVHGDATAVDHQRSPRRWRRRPGARARP